MIDRHFTEAWLYALPVVLVFGVVARWAVRNSPPPPRGWLKSAMRWFVLTCALGPLATAALLDSLAAIDGFGLLLQRGFVEWFQRLVGSFVFMTLMGYTIGLIFFAPPYLLVILMWSRLGPRLGQLESTRRGTVLSGLILAAPAGLVAAVSYGTMATPQGYQGGELIAFSATILAVVFTALMLPRLLARSLRPGAFSGEAEAPSEAPTA